MVLFEGSLKASDVSSGHLGWTRSDRGRFRQYGKEDLWCDLTCGCSYCGCGCECDGHCKT